MNAPVTHLLPLTSIHRGRMLEGHGKVLVRVGQEVSAVEVIAEESSPNEHLLIDVPSALGLAQEQFSKDLLACKEGDRVEEGDVIAEAKKIFQRILRAPAAGSIVMVSGGLVILEVRNAPIRLQAGYTGSVVDVIPDRGAILEATGALLQGIWGNGRINQGLLKILVDDPYGEVKADHLDLNLRGGVVLIGHCSDASVLRAAQELPLNGLILGSMRADLIPVAENVEFPVILLEGFGRIPVNDAAFKILRGSENRDISLNAAPANPYRGERPELFIPLQEKGEYPQETAAFKDGQTVRILSAPHQGAIGKLEEIHFEPVLLANGLRVKAATILLQNDERVPVPLNNIEVIN